LRHARCLKIGISQRVIVLSSRRAVKFVLANILPPTISEAQTNISGAADRRRGEASFLHANHTKQAKNVGNMTELGWMDLNSTSHSPSIFLRIAEPIAPVLNRLFLGIGAEETPMFAALLCHFLCD
jgi:hypothetical protein